MADTPAPREDQCRGVLSMWFGSSHERRRRANRVLAAATKSTIERLEGRVLLSVTPSAAAKARELRGPLAALSSNLSLAFEQYADDLTSGRIVSPAQFVSPDKLLRQSKGRIAIDAL